MEKSNTKYFKCCLALIILVMSSGCAGFPGRIKRESTEIGNKDMYMKLAFNEQDISKIKKYYGGYGNGKKMPPGLAKKQHLPAGLQKQLVRNKTLPPGIQIRTLPRDLERILSPLPKGYLRLNIGTDIVIINQDTDVILDILYNVVL